MGEHSPGAPDAGRSRGRVRRAVALVVVGTALAALTGCASPAKTTVAIFLPFQRFSVKGPEIVREAQAVGVNTVRFSQTVGQPVRSTYKVVEDNGLRVVVTAINDPQPDGEGHDPGRPPQDLARYGEQLGTMLDGMAAPEVVQIENEENSTNFYVGAMGDYAKQLDVAVEVGHRHGVKITNGGITSKPLALLVWRDYFSRGLEAQADDFAARVFTAPSDQWILRDLRKRPFTGLSRQPLQDAWDRAAELIPAFASNDMDYVNFHWYTDDDEALTEAVHYLQRATGKPAVTTEIGQYNTSPDVVNGHLRTLVEQLHLPLVVWFDADGIPALGLHEEPGTLRDNGKAFAAYVRSHPALVQGTRSLTTRE